MAIVSTSTVRSLVVVVVVVEKNFRRQTDPALFVTVHRDARHCIGCPNLTIIDDVKTLRQTAHKHTYKMQ